MHILLAIPVLLFVVSAVPIHEVDYCEQITTKCQNPCQGANRTDDRFVCGDPRLGPKQLPTKMLLADITHPYKRFGGLCPSEFLTRWTVNGSYTYPPQNGFQLDTSAKPIQGNVTLAVGTLLDRFGSEYGTFVSPAYAPYTQRSLPPSNLDTNPSSPEYPFNYHLYNVSKEFVALSGPIAPWFGQPGEGVQFVIPSNVMTMIKDGFLVRVNLTGEGECL